MERIIHPIHDHRMMHYGCLFNQAGIHSQDDDDDDRNTDLYIPVHNNDTDISEVGCCGGFKFRSYILVLVLYVVRIYLFVLGFLYHI